MHRDRTTSELIDAKRVAKRLGVSPQVVWAMARQDGGAPLLPSIRIGRLVRFDPEAIEAFIERGGAALPGGWRRSPTGETQVPTREQAPTR